ncbi:MAG: alpha/beta hydrolase, partial [Ferruginibacter sp.]|nr:alpha/beta hydrolase [Ferruginibacter sp.]
TYSFVEEVAYPVIIFHGTKDRVIPLRCAKKLLAVLKKTDKFITVDGATHQDINAKPIYYSTIDSLLK